MTTLEIGVHVTEELYNADGFTPRDKAAEYLQGAFNQTDLHNVDIVKNYNTVPAPQEIVQESFQAVNPCTGNLVSYESLAEWWHDELQCNTSTKGSDCNLLLTDYDSEAGECWNDWASCSEGGRAIGGLPAYTTHGQSDGGSFDSMQTALHETAHALLDGTVKDHEVGENVYYDGQEYRTPMAKQDIYNECGRYSGVVQYGYWAMHYSNCCYENMG
jgi:hypothetical protein